MLCIFSSLSQLLSANHSMLLIGRLGRSSVGYGGGSRSSISSQDSHGMYSSRQGMSYGGGGFFANNLLSSASESLFLTF